MSQPPSLAELQRRVKLGDELFRKYDVNWAIHVNPNTIDVIYEESCPIGQYFDGEYVNGLVHLGLTPPSFADSNADVVEHGFDLSREELLDEDGKVDYTHYRQLNDTWRKLVGERHRHGVTPVPSPVS